MQNVTQVMPATPWVAVYARTNRDGTDRREEAPLVGWALTTPDREEWRGMAEATPQQQLVGMVAAGRGVELVDPADENFRGYELPLRVSQRGDLDDKLTQREWDAKFTTSDRDDPPLVLGQ